MPLVSIIVNCYNGSRYLREALDSVYQQTFKDFEIIFWDDCSTDNSSEIAQSYGSPLRYFRSEKLLPLGAVRNAACAKVKGKYIAFCDCDDVLLPQKLEKQISLIESNKELGLVYSDCYLMDSEGNIKEKTYFNQVTPLRGMVFNSLFKQNFIPNVSVVANKKVIEKAGGYNFNFRLAEDYDLWLRVVDNYPVDYINQPLVKIRVHDQRITYRNHMLIYKQNLIVRNHWLMKKPTLIKELGGRWKALKIWPTFLGSIGNILRNRTLKSVKESLGLWKYMLLREYEKGHY
jgi:glycosyltransferase involved in cell wall biosynthesis